MAPVISIPYLSLRSHLAWHTAAPSRKKVKKLQESQSKTQAALKRKMEEHSIAMRKVTDDGNAFSTYRIDLEPQP